MNKIIVFIFCFFICYGAISQPISYRASDVITVSDGRLQAQYNLFIPRYTDTTAANLKKGIDSCGALIYTYEGNKVWKRSCNPKRWEEFGSSGGTGTVTSISQAYGITNTPNPITTTGTIKVDTTTGGLSGKYLRIVDTTNKWVQSVTKVNDSTIRVTKNGVGTNIVLPIPSINNLIDSLKRSTDSVFAQKNGSWIFQYKDSVGSLPTFTPTIVPYANSSGNLTGAISDLRYISNILYIGNTNPIGTENAIDLNNGRATIYGNYNGMRINVGSGTTGTVDAVKGISFWNRGTRYGYFGSSGTGGVGNHWLKLDSADLYFPRLAGTSDSIAVIEATTGKVKPKNIPYIDSLKRSNDSIYARKNGVFVYQYKDSVGVGTVISVATGYGLSGGTITSSGTLLIDSATLSTKYLRIVDTTNKWISSVSQPNDSTLTFVKDGSTTSYTIRSSIAGSATRLVTTVYNNSGSTIAKGSVVYINGAHSSNLPTIALAKANQESTSAYTYGLVETDITNNSSGVVIQSGTITNLNLPTSTYTDGQTLYLSPTTAGGYTTTKPLAPNHYVAIGTITRAHPTFGTIQIAIRNGFQLDEMSDVQIPAVPNDSTLLQFSRVDSLWHAVSVTNAIGTNYIKPSDTSVFQRKSVAAFTFKANNTNATANVTDQAFKDTVESAYTGTINWTGTAPTGTTNHRFKYIQIGKLVVLQVLLNYGTAGASNTQVTLSLPSGCPSPIQWSGSTGANDILSSSWAYIGTSTSAASTGRAVLVSNSSNNGFNIIVTAASGSARTAGFTMQYFAQ